MTKPHPLRPSNETQDDGREYRQSSLYAGFRFVRVRWKLFLAWAFGGFVIGAALSYAVAPRFKSAARIALPPTPSRGTLSSLGALGSLGSAFGLSLGSGNYSPEFIMALVRGRNIIDSVLQVLVAPNDTVLPLAHYLGGDDSLSARAFDGARESFRGRLGTDLEIRTGIVGLSFWDTDPETATVVLQALLDETNRQLIAFQRNHAMARRDYLADRVAEAYAQLTEREEELAEFREANRNVANSPILQLEAERLNRRVSMTLDSYRALQDQLDAAELEMRSDIPELMIVENPEVPVRKFFPRRRIMALAFALLAALGYGVWAATRGSADRVAAPS